ncbi:hypothetical protein, partial [Bacillus mycoides]|uniref:hypothetical protein n=1 Tax=Bacillus mycoides TaxID=1405 RepID=UPI003804D44B
GELFPRPYKKTPPTPSLFEGAPSPVGRVKRIAFDNLKGFGCSLVGQVKYSLRFAWSVLIDQHIYIFNFQKNIIKRE